MTDTLAPAVPAPRVPSARAQTFAIVTAGFGQNLILTTVTTFITVYLLQYARFDTAAIAVVTGIITVSKVIDAISDPLVGSLIDRTQTRWGKLRPFVLFSAAPVAVLTTLLFAIPDLDQTAQLVFFGVVFFAWGISYTFCDVPLWGLIGSAFSEPGRRNHVVSLVRAFGAISLGIATLGLPQLARILSFADETTSAGWSRSVGLIAVVGMGLYLLAFFRVRERESAAARERLSFGQLFGTLFRNTSLLMVLLGSILGFGRFIVQAGGAVFVVIAYNNEGAFSLVGAGIILGLVAASFATPALLRRWSGRALVIWSSILGAIIYVATYFAGFQNIYVLLVFITLSGLSLGVFSVCQATMIADSVDDVEERTGVRNDGISFATLTFSSKIMNALAVLAFGIVIVVAGYQAGIEITPALQNTIFIGITLIPAASCLLSAIPFFFYHLGAPTNRDATLRP